MVNFSSIGQHRNRHICLSLNLCLVENAEVNVAIKDVRVLRVGSVARTLADAVARNVTVDVYTKLSHDSDTVW